MTIEYALRLVVVARLAAIAYNAELADRIRPCYQVNISGVPGCLGMLVGVLISAGSA